MVVLGLMSQLAALRPGPPAPPHPLGLGVWPGLRAPPGAAQQGGGQQGAGEHQGTAAGAAAQRQRTTYHLLKRGHRNDRSDSNLELEQAVFTLW
ncbi:General transcription factor 3C polypeptide 1 [Frankliniella fusca]|uniref:General transcription factor 3C polypeptide 1 n=1 Tax=Frankliniella fusca TaxID=407009 RepID=A0AAE1LDW5_9NEOP|nr:General transcription factor 3C polypeptide 1 [Frankliniella fusca]